MKHQGWLARPDAAVAQANRQALSAAMAAEAQRTTPSPASAAEAHQTTPSPASAGEGRGEGAVSRPRRKTRPCPCHAVRLALLGVAAAVAAWAAFGQGKAQPPSPLGAVAQKAAQAASAVSARAASAAAVATSAAASVAAAASSVSATARDAAAAAASAAALPATAASAVRSNAGTLVAAPSTGTGTAAPAASPSTRPAPAASAPARQAGNTAAPCVKASDGTSFCADPLQLVFQTVSLPNGRLGQAYGPRAVVQGGALPYTLDLLSGKLPDGLVLSDDGRLGGTPTVAGRFRFTLAARDASNPALSLQQAYAMRIETAAPDKPASEPPTPPGPPPLPKDITGMVVGAQGASQWRTFQLVQADLDQLVEALSPAASDPDAPALSAPALQDVPAAPAAPPPAASAPGPSPEQLKDLLTPLLNVEYPTRHLLHEALEARRCSYYKALLQAAAKKAGSIQTVADTPECPPRKEGTTAAAPRPGPAATPAPTSAKTAASAPAPTADPAAEISPEMLYERLLPDWLAESIYDKHAPKLHDPTLAKPVMWAGEGCGCVPKKSDNEVYAFYPFWSAAGAEQKIDFHHFTRIGFLGGLLNDDGSYKLPTSWDTDGPAMADLAYRHGVALDLVVYRRDWWLLSRMKTREDREAFAARAATEALAQVDKPLSGWYHDLKRKLLRPWGEPPWHYSGLTVFFDDVPAEGRQGQAFMQFYKAFVNAVIDGMRRNGRNYALNLVLPDQQIGKPGAYNYADLWQYLQTAEGLVDEAAVERASRMSYQESATGIRLQFLVLLSEPTSPKKKALRADMDRTPVLRGPSRVVFLNSVVPVLTYPGTGKPAPMPAEEKEQLRDDLAYMGWQFGGAGFWPVTVADAGMSRSVIEKMEQIDLLKQQQHPFADLCGRVCVNRSEVRLLFQGLLLVGVLSLGAFALSCQVRRLGRKYLMYLWAGGIATLLVGMALLSCDPQLAPLRERNYLLYALIAVMVMTGIYLTMRPKDDPP